MSSRPSKRSADDSGIDDSQHSSRELSPPKLKQGPRSCGNCHRRKIRCDHGIPCKNCARHDLACEYPTRDAQPARKAPSLQDISSALERLETLLSRFIDGGVTGLGSAAGGGSDQRTSIRRESRTQVQTGSDASASLNSPHQRVHRPTWELLRNDERAAVANDAVSAESTPSHAQGNTRPATSLDGSAPGHVVELLQQFYPETQLALRLWNVYLKSVDPLVKVLHIPTIQSTVLATILDPKLAPFPSIALTFAIFYAAVTALCHDPTREQSIDLPLKKTVLLSRYKMCLDQLLTVTDLMSRPEVMALQAVAIYVTSLRANEVGRRVWVLNGLAIRLAQSIGLHRDGATFRINPFEAEMRLRLWWHLCVIDSRAPEDQGFQPAIDVANSGLRLPLNVNDNQLYPDMTVLPQSSKGWTEMSFFLTQAESCRLVRPVVDAQANSLHDIKEKRKAMRDPAEYLQEIVGRLPDSEEDLSGLPYLTVFHTKMGWKKMMFVLQLREDIITHHRQPQDEETSSSLKHSFQLACEVLESSYALLKGHHASQFSWFFNLYTQWYALTYVLRFLCTSPSGPGTERAWWLVEELFPSAFSDPGKSTGDYNDALDYGSIWHYLDRLRQQAMSVRQHTEPDVDITPDRAQATSSDKHLGTTQHVPYATNIPSPDPTAMTEFGANALPSVDGGLQGASGEDFLSSSHLTMPGVSLLDWDAVINSCLDDGNHSHYGWEFEIAQ